MKVYVATDHAGFALKEALVPFVRDELRHEVIDLGASELKEDDDYPALIRPAADAVRSDPGNACGIILGGSGQGEAMVANRLPGVRAAVFYGGPEDIITLSREHNDANVLSLGARFLSIDEAKAAIRLWLSTRFSGEARHVRRIHDIDHG